VAALTEQCIVIGVTFVCSSDLLAPYIQQIFILMFQRLQSSKTTKCVKCKLWW